MVGKVDINHKNVHSTLMLNAKNERHRVLSRDGRLPLSEVCRTVYLRKWC